MPAEGGEAVQVTKNGGGFPSESPDGRYLYYAREEPAAGVWRMPVEGGEEESVAPSVGNEYFAVANEGIYFTQYEGKETLFKFFSFATRKVTTVARTEQAIIRGFTVSPDGRQFFYTRVDVMSQTLMLVDNFR
jgi:hypothetical protein